MRRSRVAPHLPVAVTLPETRKYQKSTEPLTTKLLFPRLVREPSRDSRTGTEFQLQAVLALQEAARAYFVGLHKNNFTLRRWPLQL